MSLMPRCFKRSIVLPLALLGALFSPGLVSAATGHVDVTVAIDFGLDAGAPLRLQTCVREPVGTRGAQALHDAVIKLGLASKPEIYNPTTGLLCSIAGVPKSGCGERSGTAYRYWAYFHSSNTAWTYASNGPAANVVSADSIEGWRFEDHGTGHPGDPAPRFSPLSHASCAAVAAMTTTTTSMPSPQGATSVPSLGTIPPGSVQRVPSGKQPRDSESPSGSSKPSAATAKAGDVHSSSQGGSHPWASLVSIFGLLAAVIALAVRWRAQRSGK